MDKISWAESGNQSKLNKHLLISIFVVRVIQISDEHDQKQTFAEKLEERARNVLGAQDWQASPFFRSSFIEDGIALTLHHIERLRALDQDIRQSLLRGECYIDTELMQMEQRTPRYSPYRFPEREKLQRRLSRIAEERRRHIIAHAEKLDGLHNRLLSLLNKHGQLEHAVRTDSPSWR